MPHIPVLLHEVKRLLEPRPGQDFIDATFGGGGHSNMLLRATAPTGRVLAVERDPSAFAAGFDAVDQKYKDNLTLVNGDFRKLESIAESHNFQSVDAILLDLGVSSDQLDAPERGFSFQNAGPLDMRFDRSSGRSAENLLAKVSEKELARILRNYGEERFARSIARAIVQHRERDKLQSTDQLFALIKSRLPPAVRHKAADVARRTFQALRIAVNDELSALEAVLPQALDLLKTGGRLAVISFHSLEDRQVKRFFQAKLKGCTCPPEFPVCVCGRQPEIRLLTRKPVQASEEETASNSRSRSAKLRVAQKI